MKLSCSSLGKSTLFKVELYANAVLNIVFPIALDNELNVIFDMFVSRNVLNIMLFPDSKTNYGNSKSPVIWLCLYNILPIACWPIATLSESILNDVS